MENYLKNLDPKILRLIKRIAHEADREKVRIYLVGGIVRDLILKRKNYDIDIVIEADAMGLAKRWAKKFRARCITHKVFLTATWFLPGDVRIDFASARKESYPKPGILPFVQRGTLQDDLFRRDFTINSLAICLNADRYGQVIDMFAGLSDLNTRKIRVLHEQSFRDDPTRILRAIRFEQRFAYTIEKDTQKLLTNALKKDFLAHVTPPRYFTELKKILMEEYPLKSLRRLTQLKGWGFFTKNLQINFSLIQTLQGNIPKLKKNSLYRKYQSWWLIYFMGVIGSLNVRWLRHRLGQFHLKKEEIASLIQSQKASLAIKSLMKQTMTQSEVYKILQPLNKDVIIFMRTLSNHKKVCQRIDQHFRNEASVKVLISGDDLIRLGCNSGKKIGEIIQTIYCMKLDRQIYTRREELSTAKQLVGI